MLVEEDYIEVKNGMEFHSYYSIDDMVGMHLVSNFEENTEIAYAMLFAYMKQHQLEQVTPIYHVFTGDESFSYVTIKIGTAKQSNESVWK